MKRIITLGLLATLAVSASAQVISDRATLNSILGTYVNDDFESFNIGFGEAVVMDTASLNSGTVVNGQGPNLVNLGVTYQSGDGSSNLQWNGDSYFSIATKSILSNGGSAIHINYSGSTMAMGLDLKSFVGYAYSGSMEVYNGATLVDTVNFSNAGTAGESSFVGYQNAGGITKVIVQSASWQWSPIIDDHTYAAVPEPGTLAALGLGLLVIARRRRK